MTPLPDDQRQPGEMAFTLSFEPPHGKARRRTPDNSADFQTCTVRLRDDDWTAEEPGKQRQHINPKAKLFHDAMLYVLASGDAVGPGKVSRAAWMSECIRRNLIEPPEDGSSGKVRGRKAQPVPQGGDGPASSALDLGRWRCIRRPEPSLPDRHLIVNRACSNRACVFRVPRLDTR